MLDGPHGVEVVAGVDADVARRGPGSRALSELGTVGGVPPDLRRCPTSPVASTAVRGALDGRTMVLSHATNIRWLTGFGGSLAWVVIDPKRLVVRHRRPLPRPCRRRPRRQRPRRRRLGTELEVRTKRPELIEAMVAAASADGGTVLAEAEHLSHAAWSALAEQLPLEPAGGIVEQLRRTKDAGELARMAAGGADRRRHAWRPSCRCWPSDRPRPTSATSWSTACAAPAPTGRATTRSWPAARSWRPRPHHQTSRRTIVEGDTVIIDVGALVDGYHSDMTRTYRRR